MNDLKLAWDKAQQRARDRAWKFGTVGKHNPDLSVTYTVTGRTDRLWVTLADKTVVEARNEAGVPQTEDYPVKMEVRNGVHVIVGRDTRGTLAVPTETPASGVLPHPMADHTDWIETTPAAGNVPRYDGDEWRNTMEIPEAVGATIHAATAKTTPVDADTVPLIDSAASNVLKKLSWANLKLGITAMISAFAAKVTPVDADSIVITDSAAADAPKRVTLTNVKAFLKTYFDTLYGLLATANTWTANNAFNSTATSGSAVSVTRDLAAASTDAPVVSVVQDNAGDDQIALRVQQDGTGKVFAMFDGATEVMSLLDGGKLDLTGPFRAFGTGVTPSAVGGGQAIELWYWTGAGGPYGLLLAFDRDAGTYKPVRIAGDSIGFEEGASRIMTIDGGFVGILVSVPLTPLQVHVGTNQNLGVASVSGETTITAYNDTGAANVPLRIASDGALFVQPTIGNAVQSLQSTSTGDDPIEVVVQARVATTNATTTTLWSGTLAASTTYTITATLVARRTGGAAGAAEDSFGQVQTGVFKLVGGAAVLVGWNQYAQHRDQIWTAVFDVTGATVRIRVTGALSNNIVWHATIRLYPVSS